MSFSLCVCATRGSCPTDLNVGKKRDNNMTASAPSLPLSSLPFPPSLSLSLAVPGFRWFDPTFVSQ